ncbi:MAG: TrkA family potassium uptake protein [Pseudomonadota bacterium]
MANKRFAVIGLGNFGFHVAKSLFEEGHEVVAIDQDRKLIREIDPYCTEAVIMDATDKENLLALGLHEMDSVIVSAGEKISNSILICLHLNEIGVKKILAKAMDDDHAKILKKVGATEVIRPEMAMAIRVAKGLSNPNILDFIPLAEDYNLLQVDPPKAFIGKTLRNLDLRARYHVNIIAIKEFIPENFVLAPPAEFVIKDSDLLIILGKSEDIRRIKELK